MNKREIKSKEEQVKLIKKVTPNKSKLASSRDGGTKTELIKSVGHGCVPVGAQ